MFKPLKLTLRGSLSIKFSKRASVARVLADKHQTIKAMWISIRRALAVGFTSRNENRRSHQNNFQLNLFIY
jgi:hypothetical protein